MADLNRLIDEVLSMAKDSQNLRKKKQKDDESSAVNQSWDDTPAGQAYWKDIRGRNTDMEKQRLVNQGALDLAREYNAGQMARQALMEDTKRADDVRDYNLNLYKEKVNENVGRFNAQTLRQAAMTKQETAGSKEDPRSALFTALSQPGMTDEEAVRIKKMFDSIYGTGQQPTVHRQIVTPSGDDRDSFITPGANTKQPSAPGSQSMTFPTNMGTAGKNPLRERAEVEDSFYRMNPHLKRKKKDSLFAF